MQTATTTITSRVRHFSSHVRVAQQQASHILKESTSHSPSPSTAPTHSSLTSPPPPSRTVVNVDSNLHFYRNKLLDEYVQQKTTPITLRQLLFYERQLNTDRLLKSANYVRRELPVRISHRIREFQKLPFIVGTNPHIQSVYDIYWQAFERLRKVPPIRTLQENDAFCDKLIESLQSHMVAIPRLVLGISECEQHIDPDRIDRFMHATLRSRVSRRVLAEQHLALSQQLRNKLSPVFSSCSARDTVAQCVALARAHSAADNVQAPEVMIDGQDVWFTYIFDHIEYIIYQLLSNSFRHTIATHPQHTLPPIKVTVCSNDADVLFRISDQGGGMSASIYNQIWSYGQRPHARFGNFRNVSQLAARITEHDQVTVPLGIGLPMSRVYTEYWGGNINIVTMDGWGTDAYVRVPRFGTQLENLDVVSEEEGREDEGWPMSHRRFVV
ncbi:branched-chain alpha-ketoacid dehydrogenase [Zychaea mexicana]|uniref:branched-chain alpha-ketoacid dehydrogenase n=1 Tax=Zychaea mexicana TaxID=64656 RepID=UPI0022FEC6B3|nr:branched-chain alpha-ketoacid dehydrogenase [Zychaea mexicana]KAI9491428.1 branched-chain alpha-ketoacid dehydrogenase [Zychaea mexicana]